MKKNKNFRSCIAALLLQAALIQAQTIGEGWNSFNMGQMNSSKRIFTTLLNKSPENPEALYGLGEYYFVCEKYDSALVLFQKALAFQPENPIYEVAIAKIWLQTGKAIDAKLKFMDLAKKNKKDISFQLSIANAFIAGKEKDLDNANLYLNNAKALSNKNANTYLLAGEIALFTKNYNEATGYFEQAIFFDSTLCEAYCNLSDIYKQATNFNESKKYLHTAIRIDTGFFPAYKKLGEICYETAKYKEAIEAYDFYLKHAEYSIEVQEKYAYCLFFLKDYDKALAEIAKIDELSADDHVLKRLTAYIYYEKGDFISALNSMEYFFEHVDTTHRISFDYEYYAKTLTQFNKDSLAVINYLKAYDIDPARANLLEDIAKSYGKLKMYRESAKYYEMVVRSKETTMPSDLFLLGKSYYFSANAEIDSLVKINIYHKADSLFEQVALLSPNSYLGYFWRGRVNAMLDPESTGSLAKPYYEHCIELLSSNPEKYRKELIESYSYLGYLSFIHDEFEFSKENWQKILLLDPVNEKATKALAEMTK